MNKMIQFNKMLMFYLIKLLIFKSGHFLMKITKQINKYHKVIVIITIFIKILYQ
jgi:hypothetical protein